MLATFEDGQRICTGTLRLARGIPVMEVRNGRYLIDTGTPVSAGTLPEELRRHRLTPARGSLAVEMATNPASGNLLMQSVRSHVDPAIDGVVGGDVLRGCTMVLDWEAMLVEFTRRPLLEGSEVESVEDTPGVRASINGQPTRLAADTGAEVCFLLPSLLEGPVVGEHHDFYPGMGSFTTTLHEVTIAAAGVRRQIHAAALPEALFGLVRMLQIGGTLGMDVIGPAEASRTSLALGQGRLLLEPRATAMA